MLVFFLTQLIVSITRSELLVEVVDPNQKKGYVQLYDITTNKMGEQGMTIRDMTKKL